MNRWRSRSARGALTAAVATLTALAATAPAQAHITPGHESAEQTWGARAATGAGQANAWVARISGIPRLSDVPLGAARHPAAPDAPELRRTGTRTLGLSVDRRPVGKVSALFARTMADQLPGAQGTLSPAATGTAYADAGGGTLDLRIPTTTPGGENDKPTVIGIHLEGLSTSALARPGKPVAFTTGFTSGGLYVGEKKVVDLGEHAGPNTKVQIPGPSPRFPLAVATVNEQVTTDAKGVPDKVNRPDAGAGYVNAVHLTVLGPVIVDVTVGHSAVIAGDGTERAVQTRSAGRDDDCPPDPSVSGDDMDVRGARLPGVGSPPPFPPPACVPTQTLEDGSVVIKGEHIDTHWWVADVFDTAWKSAWSVAEGAFNWAIQGAADVGKWISTWF
ncbi:hypothetical protein AB0J38_44625 [Streptomyces sp. NPDC050095]|uniref:hypothetical protein n=1 Tax=unclassified Streptomyces TaxID=2593676 RepID=UPI00344411BF